MRSKPARRPSCCRRAHAIEREFQVMGALHATAVPVPSMLMLCEDESVIGRAFYVMEFMPGRVLWDQSLPSLAKPARGLIYDEMNRVIAALHSVDVTEVGLGATASRATTSSARSVAGPSSTWRRSQNRSRRWIG
jgi:aminoglycoside phosphotransferase (APT) family kinase protein